MSKLQINATKSSVQISAEGTVALVIGSATAFSFFIVAIIYIIH